MCTFITNSLSIAPTFKIIQVRLNSDNSAKNITFHTNVVHEHTQKRRTYDL